MPVKYNRAGVLPLRVPPPLRGMLDSLREFAPVSRNAVGVAAMLLGVKALERALRADPNAVARVLAWEDVEPKQSETRTDLAAVLTEVARVCRVLNPGTEVVITLRRGRTAAFEKEQPVSEWERLHPWSISVDAGTLGTERRGAHGVSQDIADAASQMLKGLLFLAKRDAQRLAQVVTVEAARPEGQ